MSHKKDQLQRCKSQETQSQSQQQKVQSPSTKQNLGKRNRNMGNGAERLYARIFREKGFTFCKTTREGSKLLDSCAIDLMFLPFLPQIKAGSQSGMNPSKVLSDIQTRLMENFPPEAPEHDKPKILIHHKLSGHGNKRSEFDTIVSMTFTDFLTFLELAYPNNNESNPHTDRKDSGVL